jgi:hypothetical protein
VLDGLLARADGSDPASLAIAVAIAGGLVAATAYAWLYVQALVRR